jgi:hypothetical protein
MKKEDKLKHTSPPPHSDSRKKSYQNDPRYRSFYENIRRAQQQQKPDYDEEVRPLTLDELEERGWDATVRNPTAVPAPVAQPPEEEIPQAVSGRALDQVLPGTIMRLDDGSVAVYKDAVSGKDYALFYFLEPDGSLEPRGIFLEQYETQRIGMLPRELFDEMRRSRTWDRDAILYHLDQFEFRALVPHVSIPSPQPSGQSAPALAPTPPPPPRPAARASASRAADKHPPAPIPKEHRPERRQDSTARSAPREPLERGRIIKINIGGRNWEAVFWTRDEIGPIVAHDTNREWALMHLDLSRFKDSFEFGTLLGAEKLLEIEQSLARHGH